MVNTATFAPIRAIFTEVVSRDRDISFPCVMVEWTPLEGGEESMYQSLDPEEGSLTPYFLSENTDLTLRQGESSLIADLVINPDMNGDSDETYTLPFVIVAGHLWPDHWLDFLREG
jgi:hypothetical protein